MNMRNTLIAAALALGSAATLAHGATPAATPDVDQRQVRQAQRIEHGRAVGALTPLEAHRLLRQQAGIARAEARAKADGVVTRHERRHLHALQDAASRNIRQQMHDGQRLPAGAYRSPRG